MIRHVPMRNAAALAALALATAACGGPTAPLDNVAEPANMAMPMENEMIDSENAMGAVETATAALETANGTSAGSAIATRTPDGVSITVSVSGMTPGERGVHVHMVGKCEAPTFASAGAHWNPRDTQHGLENPDGAHAGDMPNLTVGADGTGTLTFTLRSGTMDELLDADGSAFVVHAGPDDQKTDPSGNSGDRVACGVFAAG